MVTYINKELYNQDSIPKEVIISYDGGTLTSTDLYNQEMTLTESICSETEIKYGSCEASELSFKIANVTASLKGKILTVTLIINHDTENPLQLGVYKVYSDQPSGDRNYRNVKAYDLMYDILNLDYDSLIEWYEGLTFPMTVKAFRDLFFGEIGVAQETQTLPCDSVEIGDALENVEELTGKNIVTSICEMNGCFGHISRDNKFKYVFLPEPTSGTYPRNDLYPSDDLFPQGGAPANLITYSRSLYISCEFEDYISYPISKVVMKTSENDLGITVGTGNNTYVIDKNILVDSLSVEGLEEVGTLFLDTIKSNYYRPFKATCKGNPCYEVGDVVRINAGNGIIFSYIFQRTLSGIMSMKDNINANGTQYHSNDSNNVTSKIRDLSRKTGKLNVDIQRTNDGLSAEVSRATNAEGSLSSLIQQTATGIMTSVSQTYATNSSLQDAVNSLQSQIDNEIERFTGSAVPTLNNEPAVNWTTDAIKNQHINDIYTVNSSGGDYAGYSYRFENVSGTYQWSLISDTDVSKALADAAQALEEIDDLNAELVEKYFTKEQTNSQISQSADSIISNVSATYATKQSVTDVDNKLTNNYSTTAEMESAISQSASEITQSVKATYATNSTVASVRNSTITNDTLHYLATTESSGVTTSTSGWTTTPQNVNETQRYLWTYHTYTYGNSTTQDTSPVISGVYGNTGLQGLKGDTGDKGDTGSTGIGISEVIPLYYASASSSTPAAPTQNVTNTSTSGATWTRAVPTINDTYKYLFTCDQVKYTNNSYAWTSVVVDNATNNLSTRMSSAESYIKQNADNIELKVSQTDYNGATMVSKINQSASSVIIDASHISLVGKNINLTGDNIVLDSTYFSVSKDGVITAKSGKIGCWNITEDRMYDNSNNAGYTGVNKYGAGFAFWAGGTDLTGNNAPFYVDHVGNLFCNKANVRGVVSANDAYQLYSTTRNANLNVIKYTANVTPPGNIVSGHTYDSVTLQSMGRDYLTIYNDYSNYYAGASAKIVLPTWFTDYIHNSAGIEVSTGVAHTILINPNLLNLTGATIESDSKIKTTGDVEARLFQGAMTSTGTTNINSGNMSYRVGEDSYFDSESGWAHYLILNHGDGATYYNYMVRFPFYDTPQYQRQMGSVNNRSGWINFVTGERKWQNLAGACKVRSSDSGILQVKAATGNSGIQFLATNDDTVCGQIWSEGHKFRFKDSDDMGWYAKRGIMYNYAGDGYTNMIALAFDVISSKLIKRNVQPISEEKANAILELEPVTFDFTFGKKGQGLIAEEAYKVLPEVVTVPKDYNIEDDEGNAERLKNDPTASIPCIDYSSIVPYIIKLVQMQERRISNIENIIKEMKGE